MSGVTDPALAKRVRNMILQPGALRKNEMAQVLFSQISQSETRDDTWVWLQANYARLADVFPSQLVPRLPFAAAMFCSDAKAQEVKAFFRDKMAGHPGSARVTAEAMETAHLCAAKRTAQRASAEKFFSRF